jgi:hypothetical protein
MTRKKLLKRITFALFLIFVLFIIGFYSFLAFANDPRSFWRTFNGAHVTLNGRAVPEAQIYRRPNGMLLMNLGEDNGWQLYRPDSRNIYWCNPIKHVPIPVYVYAKDCDSNFCPCVRMGSVKTEVNAQLTVEPNSIEFNSRDLRRFRVFW